MKKKTKKQELFARPHLLLHSKVNACLQFVIFRFSIQRSPYTAHNVGKTMHCKTGAVKFENNLS